MKNLAALLALAFTSLALATPALAQPNRGGGGRDGFVGGPADRMERRIDRLDQRLDLTDGQRDSLESLLTAQQAEARAWIAANDNATRAERQAFRAEHRDAMKQKLEAVLTPQQLEEWSTMRMTRQDRGRRARPGRSGRGMNR